MTADKRPAHWNLGRGLVHFPTRRVDRSSLLWRSPRGARREDQHVQKRPPFNMTISIEPVRNGVPRMRVKFHKEGQAAPDGRVTNGRRY
jgi:hypothetical protein